MWISYSLKTLKLAVFTTGSDIFTSFTGIFVHKFVARHPQPVSITDFFAGMAFKIDLRSKYVVLTAFSVSEIFGTDRECRFSNVMPLYS